MTNTDMSADRGLSYLLDTFVDETDSVQFAQAISADGMHLIASRAHERAVHDTFAAIASGLSSLTSAAVEVFGMGAVHRQIIEASEGWILISRISDTAALGVVAGADADLGLIGYEMTRLSKQIGAVLSPEVVDQLTRSMST